LQQVEQARFDAWILRKEASMQFDDEFRWPKAIKNASAKQAKFGTFDINDDEAAREIDLLEFW
jgi:hypothetical protein